MIYYHDFLIDVSTYAALGQANLFPELTCCPICKARNRLQRHGFYERNAIEEEQEHRIFICRLCCPDCGRTVSILPTFLLPYFQHTWEVILGILLAIWTTCSRQLRRLYERRVQAKQTELALFVQQEAMAEGEPVSPQKNVIPFLQRIQAWGHASFAQRWWRRQLSSFMAAASYRGTSVAPAF